jgi:hypothetical protein
MSKSMLAARNVAFELTLLLISSGAAIISAMRPLITGMQNQIAINPFLSGPYKLNERVLYKIYSHLVAIFRTTLTKITLNRLVTGASSVTITLYIIKVPAAESVKPGFMFRCNSVTGANFSSYQSFFNQKGAHSWRTG